MTIGELIREKEANYQRLMTMYSEKSSRGWHPEISFEQLKKGIARCIDQLDMLHGKAMMFGMNHDLKEEEVLNG